jgi:hypothetical protein
MTGDLLQSSLARLRARLAEHYLAPPRRVCIDLCIVDNPAASRRFALGPTIDMLMPDDPQGYPVAASITMSAAVFDLMLDDPTGFDPRSAKTHALGGVRVEGIERSAAYWLQLLKRPSATGRKALDRARARAPKSLDSVDSVDARSDCDWPARIVEALSRSTLLRISHALGWPETAWTLDQWKVREGAVALRTDPLSGRSQSVAEFIDALNNEANLFDDNPLYTGGCLLPATWEARFHLPRLPRQIFGPAQLWFGQRRENGLVTRLHCDLANSFLAQVHGRKRVRLFSPSQERAVYALDAFNTYRPCRIDAGAPDLSRFPLFADALFVDVIIEPGDLLVIPTGWFHCVWALDHTLSVSRFAADETLDELAVSCASALDRG